MSWIQKFRARRASKRRPQGISLKDLSDAEVADRDASRRAEIAEARLEAFDGSQRLRLSHVRDLPSIGAHVYLGVGYDGRLIVATSPADPDRTYAGRDESPGFASFPHSTAAERYGIDVLRLGADGTTTTMTLGDVPVAHPFVQPMPDGQLLLVGARARYDRGHAEHNAFLFSLQGDVVASFCAGDGIESVQVSPSGRVWIGYFDEGVYGNFGWGNADTPAPIGQSGLVCWSASGERLYEYAAPEGFGPIGDCYAMNVVGDAAWVCYYPDFPVARVESDFQTTAWTCGIAGANAMAISSGGRIGLVGGYDDLFDRLEVTQLTDANVAGPTTYQLVMPDGSDLPSDARVVVRDRFVNTLADGQWLRLDLEDLPKF